MLTRISPLTLVFALLAMTGGTARADSEIFPQAPQIESEGPLSGRTVVTQGLSEE